MIKQTLIPLCVLCLLFISCSDNDPKKPSGKFSGGVFVVNEGSFGNANGSISFIDNEGNVINNIFSESNDGRLLGDVVQSMHVTNDKAFIVVNNSNKVEVVDVNSFESLYTIEDIILPRYLVSQGNIGYLSRWSVDFVGQGQVLVSDFLLECL